MLRRQSFNKTGGLTFGGLFLRGAGRGESNREICPKDAIRVIPKTVHDIIEHRLIRQYRVHNE
jgi:hypothetical protein